jgi:tetratricopeptide (TPR) repeat protein
MKLSVVLFLAGLGVGGGAIALVRGRVAAEPERVDDRVGGLELRLDRMERVLQAIEARHARLPSGAPETGSPSPRPAVVSLTPGPRAKEPAAADVEAKAPAADGAPVADGKPDPLAAWLERLRNPRATQADRDALWKEIKEAGALDRVIESLERRSKEEPNDPQAFVDLGKAYLEKLYTKQGPEVGEWARKADGAFDAALALDPQNWSARFSKAMSLSFWPPIFGRGPEAVQHFETLIRQQEQTGGNRPEHAQAYVFLGGLYQQQGQMDRARELWRRGIALFPENEELRRRLGQ